MSRPIYVVIWILAAMLFTTHLIGQDRSVQAIVELAEEDPVIQQAVKDLARQKQLPLSITAADGTVMQATSIESDEILYWVMPNPAHPYQNSELLSIQEISRKWDLSTARLRHPISTTEAQRINNKPRPYLQSFNDLILVVESTNDAIVALDATTGDLVDSLFLVMGGDTTQTVIMANARSNGNFSVSDQLGDLVFEFAADGSFLGVLAPAGGENLDILDNIRGHTYAADGNLLVTVASGLNADAIAEFDSVGNYLGNFIANAAGGMDSPWDLIFRDSDILISAITSDNVLRFDLSGNFLDTFVSGLPFPQQLHEAANGDVSVSNFSGVNGIGVYDTNGTFLRNLTGVTGVRGNYKLPNGNYLATNGGGIYEVNGTTGSLVRTIRGGVSGRLITLYSPQAAPPPMPAFLANPDTLNFGDVEIGNTASRTVTLSNSGDTTLSITSISSLLDIFVPSDNSLTISSDSAVNMTVDFTPVSAGTQIGTLTFTHNAASSPDTVILTGNALAIPQFTTLPNAVSFGQIDGGDTLVEFLAIENNGSGELTISEIRSTNSLFSTAAGPISIDTAATTSLEITFIADTTISNQNAELIFTHNAASSPDTVLLTAEVITGLDIAANTLPQSFNLAQNFPNPFNPSTKIRYELPVRSEVELTIFDIRGREIRKLVNGSQAAGHYELNFEAGNLAAGIYFYRLKAGNHFVKTKKLLLVK